MTNTEALASNALVQTQRAQQETTHFYTVVIAEQNQEIDRLRKCIQRWKDRYRSAAGHRDEELQAKHPEQFDEDFWSDE